MWREPGGTVSTMARGSTSGKLSRLSLAGTDFVFLSLDQRRCLHRGLERWSGWEKSFLSDPVRVAQFGWLRSVQYGEGSINSAQQNLINPWSSGLWPAKRSNKMIISKPPWPGVPQGHGEFVYGGHRAGEMFSGQYDKGFRTGYGTYYYADGRSFVGIFLNDQREGPVSLNSIFNSFN